METETLPEREPRAAATEPRSDGDAVASIAAALLRQWAVIALCGILAAGAALAVSLVRPDRYEATASLLLAGGSSYDRAVLPNSSSPVDAPRAANTTVGLLTLPAVSQAAAREMGAPWTRDDVERQVVAEAGADSDVVTVTAHDEDPATAARLATTVARAFLAFREEITRERLRDTAAVLRTQLRNARTVSERRALRNRLNLLFTTSALENANVSLVQPAEVPDDRAAPRPARDAALGGVLGLLVGCGIVLLRSRRRGAGGR